jgi:dTDP-4-dehydrorhamnose reductase
MKVFVLGRTGMLGRYVYSYLSDKYKVVGTTRNELDAQYFRCEDVESLDFGSGDVVINCIGLIKQHTDTLTSQYIAVNSLFPQLVSEHCKRIGAKFIHISTDCVFSGFRFLPGVQVGGNYTESSFHDAFDIYGRSKSLGEPEDATIVRTSIIGEEKKNFLSLLEWVKSKRKETVKGFTNHFWNGITCLQFAKVCENIIDEDLFWSGVKHVFSPDSFTKKELVELISEVYDLNIEVVPFETPIMCDRTLSTIREDVVIKIPDLRTQLIEMKNFKGFETFESN